ncbi:hypothetical protein [Stenotrophomonas maltophilia]|uniref:hypothetical protein n=1 Tax=Stenotrophomonas maltophilia TaxID=40324 RepID=UPI0021C75516|nr:hypothetical protein [Stenotrophomonas maltophilia]MCU1067192.1 hypothetical protein [Stenotrophomonas maltophilia]MCU1139182.1 hypothetical protein [Stenotrophomonas maltophilia]
MNYPDGEKVLRGDTVDLGGGARGIVVAVIDDDSYAVGFSAEEWQHLERGALLRAPGFGLLHCLDTDQDFTLIERGRSGSSES